MRALMKTQMQTKWIYLKANYGARKICPQKSTVISSTCIMELTSLVGSSFLCISLSARECMCAAEHSPGFCSVTSSVQCFEIMQVPRTALG